MGKEDKSDKKDRDETPSKELDKNHVIILLDLASLETVKTRNGDFHLLNCDDHIGLMRKHNKDMSQYRPDILHGELMSVLDSPLNKAGKVTVYFHTTNNVLIEVNPSCRIPRTFKRFSGLMVQLLHRLKIRSSDGKDTLLKVIKNPISRHLPAGIRAYGLSVGGTLYNPVNFVEALPDDGPIMFVIGAMASGSIKKEDHPYLTEMISISEYPLSGNVAINRLFGAIESKWGIV